MDLALDSSPLYKIFEQLGLKIEGNKVGKKVSAQRVIDKFLNVASDASLLCQIITQYGKFLHFKEGFIYEPQNAQMLIFGFVGWGGGGGEFWVSIPSMFNEA